MRLSGKIAFISGAARGMGAAEAILFAKEGAAIGLGDVLETEGKLVEKRIIESGGKCLFSYLDVTSEKSWEKAINGTVEKFGGLDILVNNAGVSGRGLIEDTTEEEWDRVMNTNTKGTFLGIKAALPSLKKSDGASIINISSRKIIFINSFHVSSLSII